MKWVKRVCMSLVALALGVSLLAAFQSRHSRDVPYRFAVPDSVNARGTLACLKVHVNRHAVGPSVNHSPGIEVDWFEVEAVGEVPRPGTPEFGKFLEALEAPDGFMCLAIPTQRG